MGPPILVRPGQRVVNMVVRARRFADERDEMGTGCHRGVELTVGRQRQGAPFP